MLGSEMIKEFFVPCLCGGTPRQVKTPWAGSGYNHVECGSCGKASCTDTNEFVIWHDWKSQNRIEDGEIPQQLTPLTFQRAKEITKDLPETMNVTDSEYIDLEEYTVCHDDSLPPEERVYSGWLLTLCFERGFYVGTTHRLALNIPDGGWSEQGIPEEHKQDVQASLDNIVSKLNEKLGGSLIGLEAVA